MPKQAAIATIATGRYIDLLPGFAKSMSRHLFTDVPRRLVVLSHTSVYGDGVSWAKVRTYGGFDAVNVKRHKFNIIGSAPELFDGCSHVLYLDVTMRAMHDITFREVFGDGDSLVGLSHSWLHFGLEPGGCRHAVAARAFAGAYDSVSYTDPASITKATGGWLIGGLMGGPVPKFLEMCRTCSEWVRKDEESGAVPRYCDEPYWNSFAAREGVRALHPSYGWPDINTSGKVRDPKMRVILKRFGTPGDRLCDRAVKRVLEINFNSGNNGN